MPNQETRELNVLLDLINQPPVGIVSCDQNGNLILMNAPGTALLYPLRLEYGIQLTNMFKILSFLKSDLADLVKNFEDDFGEICENEKILISCDDGNTDVLNTTFRLIFPAI